MKKFLSILASAAVLAMPLALISAPAAAQTGKPAVTAPMVKETPSEATSNVAPKAAPKSTRKVTHKVTRKATHKVTNKAKHKVKHKKVTHKAM
jgi:U3 small nucleolar RNA-associated protein 14